MKFVLLVEGDTEKETAALFLKRWLDPQLSKRVGIQVVRFQGYSQLKKLVTKARMYLDGPRQSEIIAVVGLLDLYGPDIYPDDQITAADRYAWGVAHLRAAVGRERFRMYFAVHEFEAWLLSQPTIFPREIQAAFPGKIAQPESVDFDEPPAKLLNALYRARLKRGYKKTTYGKELFAKLDPLVAAVKCPYLKQMPDEMLALATDAGL